MATVAGGDGLGLSEWLVESIDHAVRDVDHVSVDFLAWAKRIPEPKSGTLDFYRFPFQVELYSKLSHDRDGIVMKGTQVGISAWLLRWALYWADTRGLTALYVFPRDKQLNDFSNQRVRPIIMSSSHLQERIPASHINNVHLRQVGTGFVNFRGSQTKEALDSVDADVVAFDEYDSLVQSNVPDAERRVSGPLSQGLIRRVGVPTVDDYGIERHYSRSDQRRWFVRCPSCGERQFIHFFQRGSDAGDDLPAATSAYVDVPTATLVCGSCQRPLSPEDVRAGEWVAAYPDRSVKGYHVHRLLVPGISPVSVIEASTKTDPFEVQVFWNKDLGLPHAEREGRLSREALAAAQSAGGGYTQGPRDLGYQGDRLVTAGIDSADVRDLNVRISLHVTDKIKRALFVGVVRDFDELAALMDVYGVKLACIDHLPSGRLARSFQQRFYGRVFIAHYLPDRSEKLLTWDEPQGTAGIKRTDAIDATLSLVRQQRNQLPADLPADYVSHMRAATRFHSVDDLGRRTVGYKELGAIDYLMSEVYDLMATELWWGMRMEDALRAEELTTLDEHFEFHRSDVGDYGETDYRPGPDEDGVTYTEDTL